MKPFTELKPIKEKPQEVEAVEAVLVELLRREIYLPLLAELGGKKRALVSNSVEDLIWAIQSGQIEYVNGHFEGAFSAAISRELRRIGTWDRKHGWWTVPRSKLTPELKQAIAVSESAFKRMADKFNKKLQEIAPEELAAKLNLNGIYDKTMLRVNYDFESNVRGLAVAPQLTKEDRERIAAEYTNNMRLYIKDWADEQIRDLRVNVQNQIMKGARRDVLEKILRESYGIGLNKAKFLARQETNLLVTEMTKNRYQSAGVNKYRWHCVAGSPKHPVRPMHKALDGKIFSWDNPPIVDENGARKHPGQDYNCRCDAIPIVEF